MFSLVSYQTFKSIKNTFWKNNKRRLKMVNDFDYEGMEFLVLKKLVARLNRRIIFASMNIVMKTVLLILPMYRIKNFKDCMHLLLITYENKSHYLYIKHFYRFMCNKKKIKMKSTFANIACNVLLVKEF